MALELQEVGSDSSARTVKDKEVAPSTTTVVASSGEPSTNNAIPEPSAKVGILRVKQEVGLLKPTKFEKKPTTTLSSSSESFTNTLVVKLEKTPIESPKKAENANTSPMVETSIEAKILNFKKEEDPEYSIEAQKNQRVFSLTSTVVASSDKLSTKTVKTEPLNLKKEVESPFKAENNGILPSTSINAAIELKNTQTNFPSTSNVPTEQPTAGCSSHAEGTTRPLPPKRMAEASLPFDSKRAKCDPSPSTSCPAVVKRKTRIRAKPRRKFRRVPAGYGKTIFVDPAPGCTEGDVQRILKTANTTFTVNNMPFSVLPIRSTASGGYSIQFIGKKGNARIIDVMEKLKRLPEISKVVLRGPVDMGEVFIRKIPSTISPKEVAAAVARVGGCSVSEITMGKIKKMRKTSSGQKLYICCPVESAKIVNRSGEIKVGNYFCKLRVPKAMRSFEGPEINFYPSQAKTNIFNPNREVRNYCRLCGSSRHFTEQCGVVLPYGVDERYLSFPSSSVSYSHSFNYDSRYGSGHTSGYSGGNSRLPHRNSGSRYMW